MPNNARAPELTPVAVVEIRRLVEDCSSSRPVVVAVCEGRKVEKRRGPDGQTIWDLVADGGWTVVVFDYHPPRDARTTKAYGLEFSGDWKNVPKLDFRNGTFIVADAPI